jgi:hypothetical protein
MIFTGTISFLVVWSRKLAPLFLGSQVTNFGERSLDGLQASIIFSGKFLDPLD